MPKTWRDKCAPLIARVIHEHQGEDEGAIRAALREAYPFGERRMWPYKVWCSEVNYQLGKRRKPPAPDSRQLELPL